MSEQEPTMQVTDDDRLWAALAWIPVSPLYPLVALLLLLLEEKKDRPFIRHNAVLALVTGIVLIPVTVFTFGLGALGYLAFFWWAYEAYQGKEVRVPLVSDWLGRNA